MMDADTIPADHHSNLLNDQKQPLPQNCLCFVPAVRAVRPDESSSKVFDRRLSNFEISSCFSSALETKTGLDCEVPLLGAVLLICPTVHDMADTNARIACIWFLCAWCDRDSRSRPLSESDRLSAGSFGNEQTQTFKLCVETGVGAPDAAMQRLE